MPFANPVLTTPVLFWILKPALWGAEFDIAGESAGKQTIDFQASSVARR